MQRTESPDRTEANAPVPASGPIERRRSPGRRTDDLKPLASGLPAWSLRDLYRALFRYRKRSIAFGMTIIVLVVVALALCPRKYTSDAQLFVRLGRESVALDPTATTGAFVGPNVTRENEINSIIQVMGSRAIIAKVADTIGLEEPVESDLARERGITELMENINIWSPTDTSVIGVSCKARSPKRAQKVVATLVDTYLEEHLRLNSTPGSYEFFDEQSKLLKKQLSDASAALRDAKSSFNLASIEGRRDALQKQISIVETQILDTESGLAASKAKIAAMRVALGQLPEAMLKQLALPRGSATTMRELLYELQTREQELLSRYTEDHPSVIAIRKQVREAEKILRSEQPDRSQATTAAVLAEQSTYESLEARAKSLKRQLARLQLDLAALNQQEVQVKELERGVKVAETNYLTYMASLEQTRVDQALKQQEISNINVIQPASLVLKPVSPKKGLTLAIAFVVAICGGVALAFLSDQLDHSLGTPEDIEKRLGLPTLVSIPHMKPSQLTILRSA
jgi:uncharacterized protein involved in exopolysaccharide biosynthesis